MDKPKINSFIQTPMKYIPGEIFPRKHDNFTYENNMFSSHVKRSSLLWVDNNSRFCSKKLLKEEILWHFIGVYLKQNITWQIGDTKHGLETVVLLQRPLALTLHLT